jgi:hypothetical protein
MKLDVMDGTRDFAENMQNERTKEEKTENEWPTKGRGTIDNNKD